MPTVKQRFDNYYKRVRPKPGQLKLVKTELDLLERRLGGEFGQLEGFDFVKALRSGSYPKQTMVRRAKVGDFDADLGVYVSSSGSRPIDGLLNHVQSMVERVYASRTKRQPYIDRSAKSSIRVEFEDHPKINIDIVPIIVLEHPKIANWGYIPRRDGERRPTSVTGHIEFVRERNKRKGATDFHKLVTVLKWWRNHWADQQLVEVFSSFALSLVLARAFDDSELSGDWLEDLLEVVSWVCRHRLLRPISFRVSNVPRATSVCNDEVQIFDPYNLDNNVAHEIRSSQREAIVELFDRLADRLQDAQLEREHDEKDMCAVLDGGLYNFLTWSKAD